MASKQSAKAKAASANTSAQALANYKAIQGQLASESLTARLPGKAGNFLDQSLSGTKTGATFMKVSLARIQSRLPWLVRKAKKAGDTQIEQQLESLEY